jgi:DNA-binding MarR family transcriptional regulator
MAQDTTRSGRFEDEYLEAVANGRYLFRRAFRIIDGEARRADLDPLAFQALVQLAGLASRERSVSELAVRLDVPPGLVSRLALGLEEMALVERVRSTDDRRVTMVRITTAGLELVETVFARCQRALDALQDDLSDDKRAAALRIWAMNFGVEDVLADPGVLHVSRGGG